MEITEMQKDLKALESFENDFKNAMFKQQAGNQRTKRQGDNDYNTTVELARSYFRRHPDLYELLAADENAYSSDEFFLYEAKYYSSDLSRAIKKLKDVITTTQSLPNE
jgi:hypothetical protein